MHQKSSTLEFNKAVEILFVRLSLLRNELHTRMGYKLHIFDTKTNKKAMSAFMMHAMKRYSDIVAEVSCTFNR